MERSERARVLETLGGRVLDAEGLRDAAEGLAAERSGDRAAARARLDAAAARALHDLETARSQRAQLQASHDELLDGARWALDLRDELPALRAAADGAREVLEACLAEQRAARVALDRVLEQRAAATAAMEEADRELGELVGVGMDETGLRRELEAAGQAVRDAQAAHAAAQDRVQALRRALVEVEDQLAGVAGSAAGAVAATVTPADAWTRERVREALAAWRREAEEAGPDPQARLLADAWTDLLADVAELDQQLGSRPTPERLLEAEARRDAAARAVEALAAAAHGHALSAAERREIDAAHEAVLAAEEATGRRLGAAAARRRLEEARAGEQALLDRFGFASYLDVVLSGGRATTDDTQLLAAERTYLAASAECDALQAALETPAELEYLDSERARLSAHTVDLLGYDPGPDPVAALRSVPHLPAAVSIELRTALAVAGVEPGGSTLPDAAARWLDAQDSLATADPARVDLAASLDARRRTLAEDLLAAEHAEADAGEAAELALRSVGAFEAELSVRVGEDAARLKRFAAAEQLRTQIDALSATLARAEGAARDEVDAAGAAVGDAEVGVDRATAVLTDHVRRARRLAAELPIDRRPEGDPLETLTELATALRDHAEVLAPEIARVGVATAAASDRFDAAVEVAQAASTGFDGPQPDDLRDALARCLDETDATLLVLDEPFAGLGPAVVADLLDLVGGRGGDGSLVFLTEDADVLGWAVDLPAESAAAVPADVLLSLTAMSTLPTTDTTTTRRWAGQR